MDVDEMTRAPSTAAAADVVDRSLPELLAQATADLSGLLRAEVELAKVELKEDAQAAARAGGLLGAAGLLGYLALALGCVAAAWGLAEVMPAGLAFVIVAAVVAVAAAACFAMGRRRLGAMSPPGRQTVETLQEDLQWARQQLS